MLAAPLKLGTALYDALQIYYQLPLLLLLLLLLAKGHEHLRRYLLLMAPVDVSIIRPAMVSIRPAANRRIPIMWAYIHNSIVFLF